MDENSDNRFDDALSLLDQGRFRDAVDAFSEIIVLDPEFEGAYGNRGLAYLNLGMEERALADFNKVLTLNPEDAMGHAMVAEILRFQGDLEEVLRHVAAAIELNEDEAHAYFIRGWLFARAGQYAEAAEDLERTLSLRDDQAGVEDLLDACRVLAGDDPRDADGNAIRDSGDRDRFLSMRGWSFRAGRNPGYEEMALPCPYAHCIRNCQRLSSEAPLGCPVFGHQCPGGLDQAAECRRNPPYLEE